MNMNHNVDTQAIKPPIVNCTSTKVGEIDTRKATCAMQVAHQAWSKSHLQGHVKLAQTASYHHPGRSKLQDREATTKISTPTN
jgi:predicted transcriptional regulator